MGSIFYSKFDWSDWLADTGHLSRDEKAIYIDLLAHCWKQNGLSTNDRELAFLVRCDIRIFRRVWRGISLYFEEFNEGQILDFCRTYAELPPNFFDKFAISLEELFIELLNSYSVLWNRRMLKEKTQVIVIQRINALNRLGKTKTAVTTTDITNVKRKGGVIYSHSNSHSRTKKETKNKSIGHSRPNDPNDPNDLKAKTRRKANGSGLERFQDFWDTWPRKVKRAESEKIWKSKKLDDQADAIIAAVPTYIEFLKNQKNTKGFDQDVAHPSTWLRGKRWEDELIVEKEIDYDEQWLNNFLKDPIGSNNGDVETAKRAARELNSMCADTVLRIVGHELDETLNSWNEETKQWINSENIQPAVKSK